MLDFTFLTYEQCFVESKKLEILEKRGIISPITDFSILLGGYVIDNYHYNNSNSLEDRAGWYWTSSDVKDNEVCVVRDCGSRGDFRVDLRTGGARPALPYSLIRNISSNGVRGRDGILEVEYGEYPQKVASKRLQDELERAYNYNQSSIRKTGKTYTTDSRKYYEHNKKFRAQIIEEYSFDDEKKYVRVKANSDFGGSLFTLSNGERYKDGDYVWVEVEPIKWLIDEKSDIALSERLLFAGVQFKHKRNYKGDFRTNDIKEFMDRYFSKDILVNNNSMLLKKTFDVPMNEIDYNISSVLSIGNELADSTMLIADKFLKQTIENASGNDVIYDIQKDLNKIDVENNSSIFGKFGLSNKIKKNKRILDELNNFLKNKEISMIKEINELENLKNILGNCVYRLNEYIKQLEELLKKIEIDIANNNYAFFENRNPEIIKQVINERLRDFKISLIINAKQYQNINMLLDNYALNISKIFTIRNTTIPSLYVEMSIQNGLLVNEDCSNAIDEINNLLVNMVGVNNELLNIGSHGSINNIKSEELTLELKDSIEKIVVGNSYSVDSNQKVLKKI